MQRRILRTSEKTSNLVFRLIVVAVHSLLHGQRPSLVDRSSASRQLHRVWRMDYLARESGFVRRFRE